MPSGYNYENRARHQSDVELFNRFLKSICNIPKEELIKSNSSFELLSDRIDKYKKEHHLDAICDMKSIIEEARKLVKRYDEIIEFDINVSDDELFKLNDRIENLNHLTSDYLNS